MHGGMLFTLISSACFCAVSLIWLVALDFDLWVKITGMGKMQLNLLLICMQKILT